MVPEGSRISVNTSIPDSVSWRTSRTCISDACVGIARRGDVILICNTNNPGGPVGKFTLDDWRQFIDGIKLGDFDNIA